MACLVALACNRPPTSGGSTDGESSAGASSLDATSAADGSGDSATAEASPATSDGPDCGGAIVTYESGPTVYTIVVDRSAATERPFDHDGDPTTPERTPRDITDEYLEVFLPNQGEPSACDGRWPGLIVVPGSAAMGPEPGFACNSDFDAIAPGPHSLANINAELPLPLGQGGNPMRAALARAVELNAGADAAESDWRKRGSLVFWGGPAGCGDSESPQVLDLDPLAGLPDDASIAVVPVGPMTGTSLAGEDGLPAGVDLEDYWATLDADPRVSLVMATPVQLNDFVFACGALQRPGARCSVVKHCAIDLTAPPNTPPADIDLVQEVLVNGESFPWLGEEVDQATCESGAAGRGFIWVTPLEEILVCGPGCHAAMCRDDGDGVYVGGTWEVPYLCPEG